MNLIALKDNLKKKKRTLQIHFINMLRNEINYFFLSLYRFYNN